MGGLVVFGIMASAFSLLGLLFLYRAITVLRHALRVKRTPPVAIADAITAADAAGIGEVSIHGRIIGAVEPLLDAPLSGREAVHYRASVRMRKRNITIFNETRSIAFRVEDESNGVAIVEPTGAEMYLRDGSDAILPGRLMAYGRRIHEPSNLWSHEERLSIGDTVYILGRAETRARATTDCERAPFRPVRVRRSRSSQTDRHRRRAAPRDVRSHGQEEHRCRLRRCRPARHRWLSHGRLRRGRRCFTNVALIEKAPPA